MDGEEPRPSPTASFDAVVASYVMSVAPRPARRCLAEMERVCKLAAGSWWSATTSPTARGELWRDARPASRFRSWLGWRPGVRARTRCWTAAPLQTLAEEPGAAIPGSSISSPVRKMVTLRYRAVGRASAAPATNRRGAVLAACLTGPVGAGVTSRSIVAGVAQLAEHRVVVPGVAGSNPVSRPSS